MSALTMTDEEAARAFYAIVDMALDIADTASPEAAKLAEDLAADARFAAAALRTVGRRS
jgi:hypothetical protein